MLGNVIRPSCFLNFRLLLKLHLELGGVQLVAGRLFFDSLRLESRLPALEWPWTLIGPREVDISMERHTAG